MKFRHFIFDIEGTTTPISFVHEILFPYSKKNLKSFLEKNHIEKNILEDLKNENKIDNEKKLFSFGIESFEKQIDYLEFLISVDRKSKPLKEIQGKIWEIGYKSGELKSILFSDVFSFFKKIKSSDSEISIYSSGSVEAQKLIFEYSNQGNLKPFISNYFDTTVGGKRESDSYKNILKELKANSSECVFFTDINEEAYAAKNIGVEVFLMIREGNLLQAENDHKKLKSFDEFN